MSKMKVSYIKQQVAKWRNHEKPIQRDTSASFSGAAPDVISRHSKALAHWERELGKVEGRIADVHANIKAREERRTKATKAVVEAQ